MGQIIDIKKGIVRRANDKYRALSDEKARLEEEGYNLKITLAKLDKRIFHIKQKIEKLEESMTEEILLNK